MTALTTPATAQVDDLAADLYGIHPGLDLALEGIRMVARDLARPRTTDTSQARALDTTQTLLATLAGGTHGNPDLLALIAALVVQLGDPATNPALATIPAPRAEQVRDLTRQYADWDADFTPRGLCAEAAAVADGI